MPYPPAQGPYAREPKQNRRHAEKQRMTRKRKILGFSFPGITPEEKSDRSQKTDASQAVGHLNGETVAAFSPGRRQTPRPLPHRHSHGRPNCPDRDRADRGAARP